MDERSLKLQSNSSLPVVLSADATYFVHLSTCVFSALDNCETPGLLHFYILDGGLEESQKKFLRSMTKKFGAKITIIPGLLEAYAQFPVKEDVATLPTYFRLSMAEVLPATEKIAVYMDCDLIVEDDILNVLGFCHGDKVALWAVEDTSKTQAYRLLNIPKNKYFNAGFFVVNLEYWREENLGQVIRAFKIENEKYILGNDGGALNGVLWDNWEALPPKWNQQSGIYRGSLRRKGVLSHSEKEILEAMYRPSVVHFIGSRKPWNADCPHPLRSRYWKYRLRAFENEEYGHISRVSLWAFAKKPHHFLRGCWHYWRYRFYNSTG